MTRKLAQHTLCVAVMAAGGLYSVGSAADPVLDITNLLGWQIGSETCLDQGTGETCPGLIDFSGIGAATTPGAGTATTATWRHGSIDDEPLSSLEVTGRDTFALAPGESAIISEFFHDNNVLNPFGEFFEWNMNLLVDLDAESQDSGLSVLGGGINAPFAFEFVETLNSSPCDVDLGGGDIVDNPNGTVCDDRWIGLGTSALIGAFPLLGPEFAAGSQLVVTLEESGAIDFVDDGTNLTVHTAEPEDSTLVFRIDYQSAMVMPEPTTLSLVGGILTLVGGMAARRRARSRG